MGSRKIKKLISGVNAFGAMRTAFGFIHYARLRLLRPEVGSVITHADRLKIGFKCPKQLSGTLVVFSELAEPEYDFVRKVLQSDSVFFDVGAGIGAYSLTAAKNNAASIHAFEPLSENVIAIRANLKANGLERCVKLNAVALSSRSGYGKMDSEHCGDLFGSSLTEVSNEEMAGGVDVTTLDSYCESQEIMAIDVLKVDAEGHEQDILEGGKRMLRESRIKVIILETDPAQIEYYRKLLGEGFYFFYYNPKISQLVAIEPLTRSNLENMEPTAFSSNIVLIHELALDSVTSRLLKEGS